MTKNTGTYNKQLFTILIMVNLLLYPFIYSFQHALTHHLDQHQHNRESSHDCCTLDTSQATGEFHFSVPEEECPICNYEFAPGLEELSASAIGPVVVIESALPSFNHTLCLSEINQCSIPRAPPAFS